MDWNNIAVILILLILFMWFVGGCYGAYMVHKKIPWTWQDTVIVGPFFWIGWGIGKGTRRLVEWRRSKSTQ